MNCIVNKPIEHRSLSYHSRQDQNEFLEDLARSTHKEYIKGQNENGSSIKKSIVNREPKLGRSKCLFLVDHNRSIRQILRQMRQKEKQYQQKIAERQRLISEDKQYQKMAAQFTLVERKIKNRLAIEQKRLQRQKSKTVEVSAHHTPPKVGNTSALIITEEVKEDLPKRSGATIQNISACKGAQSASNVGSMDQSQFLDNKQINLQDKKEKSGGSRRKFDRKIKTQVDQAKSRVSQNITPLKKLKQKQNQKRNNTLPVEPSNQHIIKRANYLKSLPRRHQNSLEKQLQNLYNHQNSDIDRVASLVNRIEHRRRLKFKNMEEKDYQSVDSKLKLLNFLYKQ